MAFCVNCGIHLRRQRIRRISLRDQSPELITLLGNWIPEYQISQNEDFICQSCYDLLLTTMAIYGVHGRRQLGHRRVCISCGMSVREGISHAFENNHIGVIIRSWIGQRAVNFDGDICHACFVRASRHAEQENQVVPYEYPERAPLELIDFVEPELPVPPAVPNHVEPTIELPHFKKPSRVTSKHCIFPDCLSTRRLRIPAIIRGRLIKDCNFYLPESCRICDEHSELHQWDYIINNINTTSYFTAQQIENIISLCKKETRFADFENFQNLDVHLCHYFLGVTTEQFLHILNQTPELKNAARGKTALAIFLIKLRTGDSNERLSALFDMPRTTLERLMSMARKHLSQSFVPRHIGLNHLNRQNIAERNTIIPNGLFGNPESPLEERKAIAICDGTYVYVQKSSNYSFQKTTYSSHKFKNLIKPFLMVACDGHIISIFGPYPANESDATIIRQLFNNENGQMRQFFRSEDIFILDRGFRDAIPELESYNYICHNPETVLEGETQLTTIQANKSRFVTMTRWVVEIVNGRFKRDFKLFRQEYFNRSIPHLMQDFSVAGALINCFHPPVEDRPDAQMFLNIARSRFNLPNLLADYVKQNNINRLRSSFVDINANLHHLQHFPRLELYDLIKLAIGTYQLKQARSYYGEHIRENGSYVVEICSEFPRITNEPVWTNIRPILIRTRIKSRHVNRKIYYSYIIIEDTANINEIDAILGYCCSCLVGNRTVGCCAHVMTVIWYLGWARFQDNIEPPAHFLDTVFNGEVSVDEEL